MDCNNARYAFQTFWHFFATIASITQQSKVIEQIFNSELLKWLAVLRIHHCPAQYTHTKPAAKPRYYCDVSGR